MITVDAVRNALRHVVDPELHRNVIDLHMIHDVQIENDNVRLKLALTTLACPLLDALSEQVHAAVAALPGVQHVDVEVVEMSSQEAAVIYAQAMSGDGKHGHGQQATPTFNVSPPAKENEATSLARQLSPINHLIGVTSGKGGVGKSVVTAMLAASLRRQGFRVGILDADITGASIPKLFGLRGNLKQIPEGILPHQTKGGIRVVSTNLMLHSPDDPVVWRGSMIAQLLKSLWRDVVWGPLDYLFVDFPPGTSDAQLTVMTDLPVEGMIMVTTPQELAGLIVRKAVRMSQEMQVVLLGIVENMSYFVCPETGIRQEIFGPSHAEDLMTLAKVPLLAQLPVDPQLALLADAGEIEAYRSPLVDEMAETLQRLVPHGGEKRDGHVTL